MICVTSGNVKSNIGGRLPEEKAVTVRVLGGCKCPNNIKYINIRSEEKLLEFSLTPKSENEGKRWKKQWVNSIV